MENFGDELRQAREARGIPLRDMAVRTKISVGTLEALERNDFRKLPGGIFGRSFVRTYALEVGLDPEAIVGRFSDELAESERVADERRRARQPEITLDDRQFLERQRRAYLLLRVGLVGGVVLAIALATWTLRGLWSVGPAEPQAAGPDVSSPALTEPQIPAPDATVTSPTSVEPVPATPAAEAAGASSQTESPTSSALVLELEFTGESWSTIGVDGKSQPARLYRPGERVRFEAATEILVDLGNAGVARVVLNGRPAKPLGASGARVRARITRENVNGFF